MQKGKAIVKNARVSTVYEMIGVLEGEIAEIKTGKIALETARETAKHRKIQAQYYGHILQAGRLALRYQPENKAQAASVLQTLGVPEAKANVRAQVSR